MGPNGKVTSGTYSRHTLRLGRQGEQAAAAWLERRGFEILARNYRTPFGELDIVARKDGELVFVEVKSRLQGTRVEPEASVGAKKQRHLIRSAQFYLHRHRMEDSPWRIDIISVLWPAEPCGGKCRWWPLPWQRPRPHLYHIRDALEDAQRR